MGSFLADVRSGLAALHPAVFPYPRFLLAFVLGLAGGFAAYRLNSPRPA
jgi:hypothetical protein